MSQQPPPPYGYPPGQPPPPRTGNKGRFWLGVLLAIPAIIAGPMLMGVAYSLGDAVAPDTQLASILSTVAGLALLVGLIVLVVFERTRWVALGMLAGFGGLFIVAAGACIALIAAYSRSG